jgi:DNA-binding response OmpR family regulator
VRLLLIGGPKSLPPCLGQHLAKEGFQIEVHGPDTHTYSAEADVILLDRRTLGADSLALLPLWRRAGVVTPVLVLLPRHSTVGDRVRSLDVGADDYLSCPFAPEELTARLRALARRGQRGREVVLRIHDLEIDLAARMVKRGGRPIHLTPSEFALLRLLASQPGKVVSRAVISSQLYEEQPAANASNLINVYVCCLRNKIDEGFDTPLILTCWGKGYLLRADSA